jgi:hypothetical protein
MPRSHPARWAGSTPRTERSPRWRPSTRCSPLDVSFVYPAANSATGGRAPDQTTAIRRPRAPRAPTELPAGWPQRGKVEFIRFIRSDHKLRILGRAIPMPDGSAYQYVTATLNLALPPTRTCSSAMTRASCSPPPDCRPPADPADGPQRVSAAPARPSGSPARRSRAFTHSPRETMCWRQSDTVRGQRCRGGPEVGRVEGA